MKKMPPYKMILRPDPEGGFTVTVPDLPGCISFEKNKNEAQILISILILKK